MKKNHPSQKYIINHLNGKNIRPDIDDHISTCHECRTKASVYKKLLSPGKKEMRPGKYDAMHHYIRNVAVNYLNTNKNRSLSKNKKWYIIVPSILSSAALLLFFIFVNTGYKGILKINYADRGMIKSENKEGTASLPLTISTKQNIQCSFSGILNTRFLFHGPGSFKLFKNSNNQYSINLASGKLLIHTDRSLDKNALKINTSKTKFYVYAKQVYISADNKGSKVALISGRMRIKNMHNDLVLKTGQGASIQGIKKIHIKKAANYINKKDYKIARKFFPKEIKLIKTIIPKRKKVEKIVYKVFLKDGSSIDGNIIYRDKKLIILKSQTGRHKIKRTNINMIVHYKEFTD
ncbi:MAG: hypothetical protein KAS64_02495 [Spirochaetes bacterium]|nr:hypothetical protein [Spirochaetota bacterium]